MKLKDIIEKVDKRKEFENQVYIQEFAEKFFDTFINNWNEQTRLISYYIGSWRCTDTKVGYLVYFFDDKPVAVSTQLTRRSKEVIEWLSIDDYKKVKEYVMSFIDDDSDKIKIADLDENIQETYHVIYYEQMFDYHKNNAIFNDKTVKIIGFKNSFNDIDYKYNPETVQIQYENGDTEWIKTDDLEFRYNLIK